MWAAGAGFLAGAAATGLVVAAAEGDLRAPSLGGVVRGIEHGAEAAAHVTVAAADDIGEGIEHAAEGVAHVAADAVGDVEHVASEVGGAIEGAAARWQNRA